jgi:hypothetical protein
MNISRKHIAVLAVVTFVVSGAWGQIVPVQDGRALDSNYRIGSGPVNASTPKNTRFSSQMYITGQVTGLAAFRGNLEYVADNQLRMTVPSADLSDFRRKSVGLSDVLAGQTYRPGAYLDASRTALGARGIIAGRTAPGTNVPRVSYIEALVPRKTLNDAMSDFRPLLGKRLGDATAADIQPTIKLQPNTPRVVDRRGVRSGLPVPSAFGASELAVFTVSRPSQRNEVDLELLEWDRVSQDDMTRVDSKVRGPVIAPEATGGSSTGLGGVGVADQAAVRSDVFLTFVYLLQKQHLESAAESEPSKVDNPKIDNSKIAKPDMNLKPLGARPNSTDLVEQGLHGDLVFNTLAGKGSGAFNIAMQKGEKQLKEANFYNAVGQYKAAVQISPENPTPRLGLSVALFGAGESLGAALQLRRAMEMFPPVMVTKLKIMRMIPPDKLKLRLDAIYKRLEGRKGGNVDPQLAMLAVYMHLSAGENGTAYKCAKQLKDAAGDDKLYEAFATYVLTGKRPAAMKKIKPTIKPVLDK